VGSPPAWIDENEIDIIALPSLNNKEFSGAKLLQKMHPLDVSKYHPSPLDALATAERRRQRNINHRET